VCRPASLKAGDLPSLVFPVGTWELSKTMEELDDQIVKEALGGFHYFDGDNGKPTNAR